MCNELYNALIYVYLKDIDNKVIKFDLLKSKSLKDEKTLKDCYF